ncbi:MAG: putative metal-binding motif-containing protein [Myxococcota bacterium]
MGQGTQAHNNLFGVNPKFTGAKFSTPADFGITADSPAYDRGAVLASVPQDYFGNPRPQGNGYDIGAFEFGSASPTPPSPPASVGPVAVDSTFTGYRLDVVDDEIIDAHGGTSATWASAQSATQPHFVTIDFGAAREIDFVSVYWAYNSSRGSFMTSQQVDVQVPEGASYRTIATLKHPGADLEVSQVSFESTVTTKLRLWQPANMGPPQYSTVLWLTEVDYGSSDSTCGDADGDGFTDIACGGTDCDDASPDVHPTSVELCGDGIDNDCDGAIDPSDSACQEPKADGCPENHVAVNPGEASNDEFTVVITDATGQTLTCAQIDENLHIQGCHATSRGGLGLVCAAALCFGWRKRTVRRFR